MADLLIALYGFLMALSLIATGLLVAFWPKRFIELCDGWSPGFRLGRPGGWLTNEKKLICRFVGLALVIGGLVVIRDIVRVGGWLR